MNLSHVVSSQPTPFQLEILKELVALGDSYIYRWHIGTVHEHAVEPEKRIGDSNYFAAYPYVYQGKKRYRVPDPTLQAMVKKGLIRWDHDAVRQGLSKAYAVTGLGRLMLYRAEKGLF